MTWDYIPPAPPLRPRERAPREVVHVDYQDVLAQAVKNERWRTLQEVRRAVTGVRTSDPGRDSWSATARTAAQYRQDVLAALDKVEADS